MSRCSLTSGRNTLLRLVLRHANLALSIQPCRRATCLRATCRFIATRLMAVDQDQAALTLHTQQLHYSCTFAALLLQCPSTIAPTIVAATLCLINGQYAFNTAVYFLFSCSNGASRVCPSSQHGSTRLYQSIKPSERLVPCRLQYAGQQHCVQHADQAYGPKRP